MKIIDKIKENKIYDKVIFVFEILVSLILGISIYKIAYTYQEAGYISKIYFVTSIIMGIILLGILIINTIKYKKLVEKLFVTYVIPIGIMFLILLPICYVPDEEGHIFKAYDISIGNIITPLGEKNDGDIYVPKQILEIVESKSTMNYFQVHKFMQIEADYEELVSVQTPAKTYFAINYLPGAMTFATCRILNINVLLACYLARFANFILFIIIGYYCVKTIPFGKLLIAIYMCLPMVIQQAASISADAIINILAFLFIVYNMKLLYQEKDLKVKQKILYYILAISISLCKYVYFPLVFMSFLLLMNKNITKRNKREIIIISTTISIILAALWFLFSQQYTDNRLYIKQNNVNAIEQIKYILSNPLGYIGVLINTFKNYGGYYLFSFVGGYLGPANIEIPQLISIILLFGLFILPLLEKNNKSFKSKEKCIMIGIAVMLILLVETGLYLTWSPLQYELVAGVQGRYFIPVFILILLALINKDKNIETKNLEIKYFSLYFILNVLSLLIIFEKFI